MKTLILLLAIGIGSEPSMSGPEEVPVGRSCWLELTGVSVDELRAGAIDVFPKGYDVEVRILQDISGQPLIWFSPNEANPLGQYDLLVVAPTKVGDEAKLKRLEWTIRTGKAPQPPPPPKPEPEPEPKPEPEPQPKVDRVTTVFEKDSGAVPFNVAKALTLLNRQEGMIATEFEVDTVDGDNETPDQYAIAKQAAEKAGLPAVVFQAGDDVVSVLKITDATTTDEVVEAAANPPSSPADRDADRIRELIDKLESPDDALSRELDKLRALLDKVDN